MTRVLAGMVNSAGSMAGPVVNSTRADNGPSASSARRARSPWSMKLGLKLTMMSGASLPAGHGDDVGCELGQHLGSLGGGVGDGFDQAVIAEPPRCPDEAARLPVPHGVGGRVGEIHVRIRDAERAQRRSGRFDPGPGRLVAKN